MEATQHPSSEKMFEIFNIMSSVVDDIFRDTGLSNEQKYNLAFHAVNTCTSYAFCAAIKRMYNPKTEERWLEAVDTFSGNLVAHLPKYLTSTAKMMPHFEFEK
ncbi:hypothetical protein [Paracoccus sp. SCSIO 75233]|uniref:hypothetical protein n=1 Tax=Paracoccus sp. SCSIO 75233 TaxID=3017782 RepID=UPI0022F0E511|nr:hypothetical protein [Paracoccus sp. SCSIO 75233]WBU55059.1 hypothetical protein PAF12_16940 [Paracoccus sp. SCSIO 75233]